LRSSEAHRYVFAEAQSHDILRSLQTVLVKHTFPCIK
jgi:hypothetical protein